MSKVRLKGPENSGFTYGGISYEADDNGFIEVPVGDAVTHAYSHHFVQTTEKPTIKPLAKDAGGAKGKNGKPGETEDAGGAKGGDGK